MTDIGTYNTLLAPRYSSTYLIPDVPLFWDETKQDYIMAAKLKDNTCLEIGYGNSDVLPYRFWLDQRPEVDVKVKKDYTFFKIILTTTAVDFSMLIQEDPLLIAPVELDAGTR
jgi:hypothetical protein